jgi:hypothetical protein
MLPVLSFLGLVWLVFIAYVFRQQLKNSIKAFIQLGKTDVK